jgi:hypothetical protein
LVLDSLVIATTSADSADKAVTGEQDRKKNVDTKWAAADQYQKALQDRYSTPGHALNYGERYLRLKDLIEQDVGIAFQKLRCLTNARNWLFDLKLKMDNPTEFGYLDYLIGLARTLIDQVERSTIEEIDFDHVV